MWIGIQLRSLARLPLFSWCAIVKGPVRLRRRRPLALQDVRDLLQPAGCQTVDPRLVFLELLVRKPKTTGELRLCQVKHHAAHAHPAAYMLISGVRYAGLLAHDEHRILISARP